MSITYIINCYLIVGHDNNAHCLAIAVNALAGAMFSGYGAIHQKSRMKEFLVVSSACRIRVCSYVPTNHNSQYCC